MPLFQHGPIDPNNVQGVCGWLRYDHHRKVRQLYGLLLTPYSVMAARNAKKSDSEPRWPRPPHVNECLSLSQGCNARYLRYHRCRDEIEKDVPERMVSSLALPLMMPPWLCAPLASYRREGSVFWGKGLKSSSVRWFFMLQCLLAAPFIYCTVTEGISSPPLLA